MCPQNCLVIYECYKRIMRRTFSLSRSESKAYDNVDYYSVIEALKGQEETG